MARRAVLLVCAVAAVGLAVWQSDLLMAALDPTARPASLPTTVVGRGPFVVGVTRTGELESGDVISVKAPQEAGSVLSYIVPDGASVKKGQLIARVDTSAYQFSVDQQRLQYETRASQVDDTRLAQENAVDQARLQVQQARRARALLAAQQQTENEQGAAQAGYDRWNVNYTRADYEKYRNLEQDGVAAAPDVQQKDQTYQAQRLALTETQKDNSYLDSKHQLALSQAQADVNVANFLVAQSQHDVVAAVARAQRRAQHFKDRLDEMEKNLKGGELYADRNGVVVLGTTWDQAGRRPWRAGDHVWGNAVLCQVASLDVLQVLVHVDEASATHVHLGQETVMTFDGLPGRRFRGKVFSIGTVAHTIQVTDDPDAIPNQRVFDVIVRLVKPDRTALRPGMQAHVQFVFHRLADCVSVPIRAVFDRPSRGKVVYVQEGRYFVARAVRTGARNDTSIVILEGLKAGERIALTDPRKVRAGAASRASG